MYTSEELVSLNNLGNGAAVEMFDNELEKVLNNLQDINKDGKAERSITLTVKFKPTDTQGIVSTQIECKSKLSGQRIFPTHLMIGHNGRQSEAREMFQQQPLQFKDPDGKVVPIERKEDSQ